MESECSARGRDLAGAIAANPFPDRDAADDRSRARPASGGRGSGRAAGKCGNRSAVAGQRGAVSGNQRRRPDGCAGVDD